MSNSYKYIGDSVRLYDEHLEPIFGPQFGETKEQIKAGEKWFGYAFPEALKEFYLWAGERRFGFDDTMSGGQRLEVLKLIYDSYVKDERRHPDFDDNGLAEFNHPHPPLVFAKWGELIYWIYPESDDPDPEVYYYHEYGCLFSKFPKKWGGTLSFWVHDNIKSSVSKKEFYLNGRRKARERK